MTREEAEKIVELEEKRVIIRENIVKNKQCETGTDLFHKFMLSCDIQSFEEATSYLYKLALLRSMKKNPLVKHVKYKKGNLKIKTEDVVLDIDSLKNVSRFKNKKLNTNTIGKCHDLSFRHVYSIAKQKKDLEIKLHTGDIYNLPCDVPMLHSWFEFKNRVCDTTFKICINKEGYDFLFNPKIYNSLSGKDTIDIVNNEEITSSHDCIRVLLLSYPNFIPSERKSNEELIQN